MNTILIILIILLITISLFILIIDFRISSLYNRANSIDAIVIGLGDHKYIKSFGKNNILHYDEYIITYEIDSKDFVDKVLIESNSLYDINSAISIKYISNNGNIHILNNIAKRRIREFTYISVTVTVVSIFVILLAKYIIG